MGYAIAFLIICVIAGLYNKSKEDQAKSLRELRAKSKTDYYDSLSQLSTNSEEVKFRIDALEKGRKYYASLRPDGKLTITDETSIANDLNAHSGNNFTVIEKSR